MIYNAYLRGLRRKWALSQQDLAQLLDVTQSRISRYEQEEETPTLAVVYGLQVIFDHSPRSLFERQYLAVQDAVMRRAADLDRTLRNKTDYASGRKRQLLAGMVARATKPDAA